MLIAVPHPLIVADIGGTNCRLGLIDEPGAAARVLGRIDSQGAGALHDAIADFIARAGVAPPRAAMLAVAGPVTDVRPFLTNARRSLDGPALGARMRLDAVAIVNDFEAQAAALATLQGADLAAIKDGEAEPRGVRLAVGPGTGFGVGLLVDGGDRRVVAPSEACHAGFGPETPEERLIWPHLEPAYGRHTFESVLSGAGLARLHDAMALADGRPAPGEDAAAIATRAASDPVCRATVAMFLDLLARAIGDLALFAKATGGAFIAGGIAPRLLPFIDRRRFAARFSDRPPMRALLERIPIHVVTADYPAFAGLGALADPGARVSVAQPAIWRA